jgi:tetratricopeptide (TPR) repeat protein
MRGSLLFRVWSIPLFVLTLSGCATLRSFPLDRDNDETPPAERTLSAIVAELHLHLRDDTYRYDRARSEGGQNVFALALWRLDRLRAQRALPHEKWENIDIVIEYARARALERLRRYATARDAYKLVAATGSRLADAASERERVMRRFAQHAGQPGSPLRDAEEELAFIEGRIRTWEALAVEYHGTSFHSLAREEAEAGEMVRVGWFERHRDVQEALQACRRLVERHPASKLHAHHLIRLGDLYAEAAHGLVLRSRANLGPFDAERYETFLDHAFALYELAGEQPGKTTRREASNKIDALLAEHEGIRAHVP